MPNYVLGKAAEPCGDDTTTVAETVLMQQGIVLYPNPADASITIESTVSSRVELVDMLGRVVMQKDLVKGETTINTASLPDGVYTYHIITEKKELKAGKLIIRH